MNFPNTSPGNNLLIIGLGNDFITDDGVGCYVTRQLNYTLQKIPQSRFNTISTLELATGGLALLDTMSGYSHCFIVDAVVTGKQRAGTLYRHMYCSGDEPVSITGSHQIGLYEALGLADILRIDIPSTIVIYGIEVSDVKTFGTKCTPEVLKAIPKLVSVICKEIFGNTLNGVEENDPLLDFPCRRMNEQANAETEVATVT